MPFAILTCSPLFEDLALNEIRRQHQSIICHHRLAPGHLLIESACGFEPLIQPWRDRLPIYLHHMCPADTSITLTDNPNTLAQLAEASGQPVSRDESPAVQVRILPDLETGQPAPISGREIRRVFEADHSRPQPDRPILSVVVARVEGCWTAFLGTSRAADNLSPRPGGLPEFEQTWPNRAGYKLVEALDSFQIRLRMGDHALDLGAAPGAWTMVLRQHGLRVTAVAPRRMYPELQADKQVTHYHMTAEKFLTKVYDRYDLITNDMRLDARDSARLMVAYTRYLRPGGIAIMTLKLRRKHRRQTMDHAFRLLRQGYKVIRVRQLVFNRSEVTLFLRRK